MRYFGHGLIIVALFVCSACQFYYADEALLRHQRMLIGPYSSEHASRHGAGFVVTMRQDEALKLKAPASPEFKRILEEQLAVDRSKGRNYCPFGYEIKRMTHFSHSHTMIEVDCKSEEIESQINGVTH